jgi:hypothetical protein
LVAWLALGVLAVGCMGVCSSARRSVSEQQVPTNVPTATPSTPRPPLPKLNAATLRAAYKANQIAADAKYQGHRYEVNGTVVSIDSGLGDEPNVSLVSALEPVVAKGLTKRFAATLNKGDNMIAECTVTGVVLDMPMLDCSR